MKVRHKGDRIDVSCRVTNTGDRAAKQVVQLYSTRVNPDVDRPAIELRAYEKTPELAAGESCVVELSISTDDLAEYSEKETAWKVSKGDYVLSLGFSSADRPLSGTVTLRKEKLTLVTDAMMPAQGDIFINE